MSKHYHFIGIGGMGMGTLAALLLAKGMRVSGSDIKESLMTRHLQKQGARIVIGHDGQNIDGADFVVYSSAIFDMNPEMVAAQNKEISLLKRAQLLAQLMKNHIGITVAGAHGKTTTTSMLSCLLMKAGLNPTTAIGGIIDEASYNAALGDGRYFAAEVDESDGSFLYFHPQYALITNIDQEHLDYYNNWDNIIEAYRKFIAQIDPQGMIIACGDDPRLIQLINDANRPSMTYGFSQNCDVRCERIVSQDLAVSFDCLVQGKNQGTIGLSVPGRHNILNAMACICMGLTLSIDFSTIQESLASYQGVNRRFQVKGNVEGIRVVDDYGHHPTEIEATLRTAQSVKKERLITVFQPHRYSRTKFLMEDFVKSLSLSDTLIITDIYAAGEPPLEGVTSQCLYERLLNADNGKNFEKKVQDSSPRRQVIYLKKEEIVDQLLAMARPGDLVLTLGAGDINRVAENFVQGLNNKYKNHIAVVGEKTS